MNCDDYQKNFSKLMDNELGEEDCAALFVHMGTCSVCREFFRTSMQIQSVLDELPIPDPIGLATLKQLSAQIPRKARFAESLFQRFRETRIPLSFATAALILVIAGTYAVSSLWMHAYDGPTHPTERVVYSYLLSPVDVKPPSTQQTQLTK